MLPSSADQLSSLPRVYYRHATNLHDNNCLHPWIGGWRPTHAFLPVELCYSISSVSSALVSTIEFAIILVFTSGQCYTKKPKALQYLEDRVHPSFFSCHPESVMRRFPVFTSVNSFRLSLESRLRGFGVHPLPSISFVNVIFNIVVLVFVAAAVQAAPPYVTGQHDLLWSISSASTGSETSISNSNTARDCGASAHITGAPSVITASSSPYKTGLSGSLASSASSKPAILTSSLNMGITTVTTTVSACPSITSVQVSNLRAQNLPSAVAASLAKEMHSEVSAIDFFNGLLSDDGAPITDAVKIQDRIVFDFNAAVPALNATGGRILVASEKNYPFLTDLGIAGTVAFLNPCSMKTPHVHPWATELLTLIPGPQLQTGMMLENGFRAANSGLTTQISANLTQLQATVFPMGSIHFQFNPTCEDAIFVAALTSSDPGTSQITQNYLFEDERIVNITLGQPKELNGKDIAAFRIQIPANLVQAMDSCVATCRAEGVAI